MAIENAYVFTLWGLEDGSDIAQVVNDFPHSLKTTLTDGAPDFASGRLRDGIWWAQISAPITSQAGVAGIAFSEIVAAPNDGGKIPPATNVLGVTAQADGAVLDAVDASGTHLVLWRTEPGGALTSKEPDAPMADTAEVAALQTWLNGRGVTTNQFLKQISIFLRSEGMLKAGDSNLNGSEMSAWLRGQTVNKEVTTLQNGTRRKFTNVINKWWATL